MYREEGMYSREGQRASHMYPHLFTHQTLRYDKNKDNKKAMSQDKVEALLKEVTNELHVAKENDKKKTTHKRFFFRSVSRKDRDHLNRNRTKIPPSTHYTPNHSNTTPKSSYGPRYITTS